MRIAQLGLGILLVLPVGAAFAQSSAPQTPAAPAQSNSDPLAAAARQSRDNKKDQAKPARVWDNDNIPKAGHEISVIGQQEAASSDGTNPDAAAGGNGPAAPDGSSVSPTGAGAATPGAATPNQADIDAKLQSHLDNAKEKLASLKTDLELMQRTLTLDSQMYYSKPDYSNDTAGARKLADEQEQIANKQQAIDDVEKEIAILEGQVKDSPTNRE